MNASPWRLGVGYLVAGAGQEALDRDGASRRWKRGLHHAAHEGVDQRRGNLPPPLHLLQDLRTDASSEARLHLQVQVTLPVTEGHFCWCDAVESVHRAFYLLFFLLFFFCKTHRGIGRDYPPA